MEMVVQTLLQTIGAVVAVVAFVRFNGLRSFSKMASFDFGLTIAAGSVLATIMTTSDAPWPGFVALAALFATRFAISALRKHFPAVQRLTDNPPLMLVHEGRVIEENMTRARVTMAELRSKLREADATEWAQVHAVVFEATGDVSVLTGDRVDPSILDDVSWGAMDPPDR